MPTPMMYEPIVEIRLYASHEPVVAVRVDAPRHPEQAEQVLREERQVEADEHRARTCHFPSRSSSIRPNIFGNQ